MGHSGHPCHLLTPPVAADLITSAGTSLTEWFVLVLGQWALCAGTGRASIFKAPSTVTKICHSPRMGL